WGHDLGRFQSCRIVSGGQAPADVAACRRPVADAEIGAGAARGPVAASATFMPAAPSAISRRSTGTGSVVAFFLGAAF
ncbi:MAG: hypothetical protein V3T83_08215, partial [Acidobacteriota bacterium]